MHEDLEFVLKNVKDEMEKTIHHFIDTLGKIRAGKATPQMLNDVFVDYYGTRTPLSQVSTVSVPDPKTIIVHPWEKSMIAPIEKAIMAANLGFNPQNQGEYLRISVPPLSEERRRQLVKFTHQEGETNKVSIRNHRKEALEEIKKLQKAGVPEDETKKAEEKVQEFVNKFIRQIDDLLDKKEKEILTV